MAPDVRPPEAPRESAQLEPGAGPVHLPGNLKPLLGMESGPVDHRRAVEAAQVEHMRQGHPTRKPEAAVAGPQLDRVGASERRRRHRRSLDRQAHATAAEVARRVDQQAVARDSVLRRPRRHGSGQAKLQPDVDRGKPPLPDGEALQGGRGFVSEGPIVCPVPAPSQVEDGLVELQERNDGAAPSGAIPTSF